MSLAHAVRRLSWLSRLAVVGVMGLMLGPVAQAQGLGGSGKAVVATEQVRAELLAWAPEGVTPGKPVWVGLQIAHQPEWHTYWKNPGDSGLPTTLAWQLPTGVTTGDIAWPTPHKIPLGTLANYGYDGTVLLPVPLTVSPDFKPSALTGELEVRLHANWLVCRKECIPQEGDFALRLPARGSTALSARDFQATLAASPQPLPGAQGKVAVAGHEIQVTVTGLPEAARGQKLAFFPETGEVIENAPAGTQGWDGAVWTGRYPLSAQRSQSPGLMPVVLAAGEGAARLAWRIEAPVRGIWPTVSAPASVSPQLEAALKANAAAGAAPTGPTALTLLAALGGALLGGLILNLMPCVFPVLAIKLLAFAQPSAGGARAWRAQGLAYTAGVVLSFLALGALMLALRAAGEQLGWGFQLQSPAVVAVLAALFTLIGLNLAGVFEFGNLVPSSVASLESKNPTVNALLSGMLAVAIASPCTAPFMGASLGFAVGLPAAQALMVFGALGLGMALPFLVAALAPGVADWLPRPGAWMDTFRRLMAFPMFLTVAWLVWVLGQQTGIDGAAALLALLVAGAMAVWAFTLAGRSRTVVAAISIASFSGLALTFGQNVTKVADPAPTTASAGSRWQAWEPGRVEQLVAAGQPVFVDFTAAWCVTCQYNKKTTLAHADVLADFDGKKVALLRADWTRRDPAITAALGALGRNGVPVYVLHAPGRPPVVLSEVLSVDEVRAALARL